MRPEGAQQRVQHLGAGLQQPQQLLARDRQQQAVLDGLGRGRALAAVQQGDLPEDGRRPVADQLDHAAVLGAEEDAHRPLGEQVHAVGAFPLDEHGGALGNVAVLGSDAGGQLLQQRLVERAEQLDLGEGADHRGRVHRSGDLLSPARCPRG
jgi:hypothetical protein